MSQLAAIFAHNLKSLRDASGKTQAQLAEDIGIDSVTIANYEGRRRWPKPAILAAIARVFQIPESRLFLDPTYVPKPTIKEAYEILGDALGLAGELPAMKRRLSATTNEGKAPDEIEEIVKQLNQANRNKIKYVMKGLLKKQREKEASQEKATG